MSLHPYLAADGPLAIAHRGGTETAPENSRRAFEAALDVGFVRLETDVHLTADGVLLAFHDDELDRVTDATGRIADLPWSAVREARIGGTDPIPTLDELLESFPDTFFNLDPKHDASVVTLARTIRRHGATSRVCVASFSDRRLLRLGQLLGAGTCRAAGPREVTRMLGASKLRARRPSSLPFDCLQVPVRHLGVEIVTPELLATAHRLSCPVIVWTIDDGPEMHRLLDMGVDGIMTDRPSVLRGVLEARDAWR